MKNPSVTGLVVSPFIPRVSTQKPAFLTLVRQANDVHSACHAVSTIAKSSPPDESILTPIWLTVAQCAIRHPAFSENAIRALIFASKSRPAAIRKGLNREIPGNGLVYAIRRVGRRVLINEKEFLAWVNKQGDVERSVLG